MPVQVRQAQATAEHRHSVRAVQDQHEKHYPIMVHAALQPPYSEHVLCSVIGQEERSVYLSKRSKPRPQLSIVTPHLAGSLRAAHALQDPVTRCKHSVPLTSIAS